MSPTNRFAHRITRLLLFASILTRAAEPLQATVIVGGFGGSRVLSSQYSVYNPSGANTELTNVGNFSLYGDTLTFAPSTTTATASYLSSVDIFFTGLLNFNAAGLSPSEISNLTNFINMGGVVVAHGDNTSFDSTVDGLLNNFGLDVINGAHNTSALLLNIINASHPVTSGPFGAVSAHSISDSAYLGPAVGPGSLLATYPNGFGAIGVVDPNGSSRKGGLLFFPDSESYGLRELGFRSLPDAKIAFNNGVAWAVGIANSATAPSTIPEPTSFVIFLIGTSNLMYRHKRGAKERDR